MQIKVYNMKRNFEAHSENDKKNSWYWSVLVKNTGSWKKAQKAIDESRDRVDPTYVSKQYRP